MKFAREMAASPRKIIRKFKLPLDPELPTGPQRLAELSSIMREAAAASGVDFGEMDRPEERGRAVIFYDTADFALYRNNFMLRKRVSWERDGATRDELVFKFRHPDRCLVAAMDPRPAVEVPYVMRFKEQILPSTDGHGMRSIFWHGCKIREPVAPENFSFGTLARVFPALRNLSANPNKHLTAVNGYTVDERLVELGTLKFAKSVAANAHISLWRVAPGEPLLANELSFQMEYDAARTHSARVRSLSDELYLQLLRRLSGLTTSGSTKVHELYGLGGASQVELSTA
jgi:hypothetical protein